MANGAVAVDDDQKDRVEQERLALARAKLSQEQRERLESYCDRLREQELYAPKYEIAIAAVIYEDRPYRKLRADIGGVFTNAANDAADQRAKDQLITDAAAVKTAELVKPRDTEALSQQHEEAVTHVASAKHQAASQEPIQGSVQRFFEKIAARELEKNTQQPEQSWAERRRAEENSGALAPGREISDAFAARMSWLLGRLERDGRSDRYASLEEAHARAISRKMS